jgi:hypothetical protein
MTPRRHRKRATVIWRSGRYQPEIASVGPAELPVLKVHPALHRNAGMVRAWLDFCHEQQSLLNNDGGLFGGGTGKRISHEKEQRLRFRRSNLEPKIASLRAGWKVVFDRVRYSRPFDRNDMRVYYGISTEC